AESAKLVFQPLRLQPESVPRALDDCATGRGLATHKQRYTQNTFVTYDRNFSRRAILHDVQQRNDGRRWKVDVPQPDTGFIEDITEPHRYEFQMGREPFVVARRQGGE